MIIHLQKLVLRITNVIILTIISINDLNFDEKSIENILIYDFAYKTPYGAKPSNIIFDIIDGYIRKYDRAKCGVFV